MGGGQAHSSPAHSGALVTTVKAHLTEIRFLKVGRVYFMIAKVLLWKDVLGAQLLLSSYGKS